MAIAGLLRRETGKKFREFSVFCVQHDTVI